MDLQLQLIFSLCLFRYCVSVQREGFPAENIAEQPDNYDVTQPAHTLTILPPIVLVNLLPVELSYCIRKHSLSGNIKPGRVSPVYKVMKDGVELLQRTCTYHAL
jgi:vacuolar protein sorting-associated protein 13D